MVGSSTGKTSSLETLSPIPASQTASYERQLMDEERARRRKVAIEGANELVKVLVKVSISS